MKEGRFEILFDSNVIIDALTDRKNSSEDSKEIFLSAIKGQVFGYLVSKQITDIYYSLRKYYPKDKRYRFINFLLKSFSIISFDGQDLKQSLLINGRDFEDDVLINSASKLNLDYIVTNNIKDFKKSPVKAISPKNMIDKLY